MPFILPFALPLKQLRYEDNAHLFTHSFIHHFSQALCMCPETGNFISFDAKAVRLWNSKKQLRAIHWLDGKRKFISAKWVHKLNACLLLIEYKANGSDATQTILQVWTIDLVLTQQVPTICISISISISVSICGVSVFLSLDLT